MRKQLDFTNIESFNRAPEGTHVAKIAKVEGKTFQSGNDGFLVTFEIVAGPGKGARVFDNYPFVDTALWKLKQLLESIGLPAQGKVLVDSEKMTGRRLQIDVYHEEWEGKIRARLGECHPLEASAEEEAPDFPGDWDDEQVDTLAGAPAEAEPEDAEPESEPEPEPEEPAPKKKTIKKAGKKPEPAPEPEPAPAEDADDDWDDWDDAE